MKRKEKTVDECNCCMSHIIASVSKKLGKDVKLLKKEGKGTCPEACEPLYKYTFSCTGGDNGNGANLVHITATEEGVLFSLLELSMGCKSSCTYCESFKDEDGCFDNRMKSGNVNYSEIQHKDSEEIHVVKR